MSENDIQYIISLLNIVLCPSSLIYVIPPQNSGNPAKSTKQHPVLNAKTKILRSERSHPLHQTHDMISALEIRDSGDVTTEVKTVVAKTNMQIAAGIEVNVGFFVNISVYNMIFYKYQVEKIKIFFHSNEKSKPHLFIKKKLKKNSPGVFFVPPPSVLL